MSKNLALPNSDSSFPPPPTSISIAGGVSVSIDDYVYMQPEYPEEPYYIGRVMEFAYVTRERQPKPLKISDGKESTPTPTSTSANSIQLRARLAWFQRPRDLPVTRVRAKDARLLVATMHSDLNPVSAIRGKCFVRHTSEISDLSSWKSKPDHYYYTQLFDRYSLRLYDIVPVTQIRNAPQEVLQKLHDTYEFIFAEPQKISDLVNTRRACTICAKWCSVNESLKCSICDKHYHMQCLDPPISRKPAKGYSWQCAACLRRIQEQRENSLDDTASSSPNVLDTTERKRTTRNASGDEHSILLRSTALVASTGTPLGAMPASATASDTESRSGSKRIKLSHGDSRHGGDGSGLLIPRPRNRGLWPFRYFGINTNIDDVLHDDERIYPRAVSRIGPKYQAIIPDMVSPGGPELDKYLFAKHAELYNQNDESGKNIDSKPQMLRQSHLAGRPRASPGVAAVANGRLTNGHSASVTNGNMHYGGHRGKDGVNGGWASSGGGGGGGGGGGTTRWYGKSAEQMDLMWDDIEVHRGNHEEQIFFKQPSFLPDDELDMYMQAIVPFLRRHFGDVHDFTLLDCQDAALHGLLLHKYDVEEALISIPECPEGYIRQREPGDYWSNEGMARFNDYLREYGSNLQSIHNSLPENTRRAITLHYYMIRQTAVGRKMLEAYNNRNGAGQRRPNLGQGEGAVNIHVEVASDAGVSSANTPASSPRTTGMTTRDHSRQGNEQQDKSVRCLNCGRDRVARWYPAPLEFAVHNTRSAKYAGSRRVVCNDCREFWLRYAAMPDPDIINSRKYQQQQHQQITQGSHSAQARSSAVREEPKRANSRVKFSISGLAPKLKGPVHWPLTPCDVCRLATSTGPGSNQALLVCQDCGLCVHYGCSGYPEHAKINPRRWKCSVCTNINNPTISIDYACILCHRDAPLHASASDRPRQMMWRTTGNNWVHPLCALLVEQSRLLFAHGNVIVDGVMALPKDTWMRRCSVCMSTQGAAVKCIEENCGEGAHARCAHISTAEDQITSHAARTIVVARTKNTDISPDTVLENVAEFIKSGEKISAILKCAKHANANTDLDAVLDAVDSEYQSVISAVVASKMISARLQLRGAMLHAHGVKNPQTVASSASERLAAAATSATLGISNPELEEYQMATRHTSPATELLSNPPASGNPELIALDKNSSIRLDSTTKLAKKMVAWSSPAEDPACLRCSATFSPIWWPSSPMLSHVTSPGQKPVDVHVLCHRCYTTGAGGAGSSQRSNITASL